MQKWCLQPPWVVLPMSFSKHYIEEIQKRFDKQEFMTLDFIDGYTIKTQSEIKIGKKIQKNG